MRRHVPSQILAVVLGLATPALGLGPAPEIVRVVEAPGARQPQAAVDGEGRIFVAFGAGEEIRCARSTDGGASFEESKRVGSLGKLALGMRRGPRIAATTTGLVITAIGGPRGEGQDGDLWAWRSADHGASWGEPTRVNRVAGSAREGLHGMAAGPDDAVVCAWLDLRHRRTELFGARSTDGGATWKADALIYRSPGGNICECCHPSVAIAPDGAVSILWRNQINGARDMALIRSVNRGRTYGRAEMLGKGHWLLDACPMDGGALAIGPKGSVETVWRRDGTVFAARPGERERKIGEGLQPWTAEGVKGSYTAWITDRPGRLLVREPGASEPLILAESANDPVLASGPRGGGPVVAVWEADAESGRIDAAILARSAVADKARP